MSQLRGIPEDIKDFINRRSVEYRQRQAKLISELIEVNVCHADLKELAKNHNCAELVHYNGSVNENVDNIIELINENADALEERFGKDFRRELMAYLRNIVMTTNPECVHKF